MSVDAKLATERAEARIGSLIKDKWKLDRLLGVGGMACVYAATHRNKKRAAVKMLHPEYSTDPSIRERFLREGYLANSVGHRGVVTVDDDDVAEDGAAFIVMELLDGETLEQRWRRKSHQLPLEEVLAVADQVLDALAAAHDKGVVHRDLKPENLFLTRDGVVKLLDFGVGRLKELDAVTTTTLSGATMGTPAFMAPEQARGRWDEVDGQTDLWALGATLFTLLTGEYVHEGQTVNETLALAVTQPARSVRSLRPDLPDRAAALIDRALSYAKNQRFADARAMQAEVRVVYAELAGQDVTAAAQLSVPEAELSSPAPISDAVVARREMTTARGVSTGLPSPLRAAWATLLRKPLVLAGAGASLLLLAAVVARSCARIDPAPEASLPASNAPVATPPPVPASPVLAAEVASTVPQVAVDQLPRERRKKLGDPRAVSGSAKPAHKDDPFARRR
ncbi:MAG TPA: serine/threonine-protein kinase [Polyangiaceae bacterium]|nr:serine/threonine-protein kinase [Polyangiaceae bacterium]